MLVEPQLFRLFHPHSNPTKKNVLLIPCYPPSNLRNSITSNWGKNNREDKMDSAACRDLTIAMDGNMDTVTHRYKNVWKNRGILAWGKEHQILEGLLPLEPEERH